MRSHQQDEAALEQWRPLIHKMAHKAAQRAAGLSMPMRHDDFVQELSIVVLRCHDSYDPNRNVKMITFLYRAIYNELNKIFGREENSRAWALEEIEEVGQEVIEGAKPGAFVAKKTKAVVGFNLSGDSTWTGEDGQDASIWDHVEDGQATPEESYQDTDLLRWVQSRVSPQASAVLRIVGSGNNFVTHQLEAYNAGIEQEAAQGGMRRIPLDMNFAFVCKLLGMTYAEQTRLGKEIHQAIAQYGSI